MGSWAHTHAYHACTNNRETNMHVHMHSKLPICTYIASQFKLHAAGHNCMPAGATHVASYRCSSLIIMLISEACFISIHTHTHLHVQSKIQLLMAPAISMPYVRAIINIIAVMHTRYPRTGDRNIAEQGELLIIIPMTTGESPLFSAYIKINACS